MTSENLKSAILNLRDMVEDEGVHFLAFPTICCGNMGMKWSEVKKIIKSAFYDTDIEILICHTDAKNITPTKQDVIDMIEEAIDENSDSEENIKKLYDIIKSFLDMYFKENVEFVDTLAIRERMKKAKLAIPKSISVAFNGLTTKGYIQPVEQEKGLTHYYITSEGILYVEAYVRKERKNKSVSKKTKTNQNILETRYSYLTKEMMNLEKYPEFSKLKTTKEKIMLIMYIMKDIDKGEFFTVNDLKFIIAKIFNDKLTDDAIKGVFKNKSSAKYFDKRNLENNNRVYEYKMIQSGFDYFKSNIMNASI